jgi:Domain of unknown function (DUF362)
VSNKARTVSRRQFMEEASRAAAGAALGATAIGGLLAAPPPSEEKKPQGATSVRSTVVLVRDPKAVTAAGTVDMAVAARMLDDAACALTGAAKPAEAWRQLFGPKDLVGIKTNGWGSLPTPPEVEEALRNKMVLCGVPPASVRLADHGARTELGPCTALLNVRPARTHHWAGMGSCIKNYIMFVETPSAYHADSCADLGAIWNLPIVKGKTRLNVLLALTPQFYGRGPHSFDPRNVWTYGGMFVSKDPVAADALGAELLRLKRLEFFGEDKPVTPTKHIEYAETRHHVGVADLKRIDLVKLGWQEKLLLA